ncbi:major facilitator superfamily transporter [Ameyamaea chiangmaiensis NBRC 103196]|uniref:MFS transporter n=1 Tax=Ameyamaea chiangmaiensis TaxID=442969 RepID=A0A850P9Z2_9PROT|nr:MFS transporter [Ameyamaea chiangmaiensis]MBS4074437.1 MFS transporter [Ameyamaea chiangmaiensis]NVN40748.1 MFS transporter [Ameyamaea chiangmaiensis]GBQ72035.1 major facilitator superfamily transporter [Ameyamaea chiangmaiensis NBRC 103196]
MIGFFALFCGATVANIFYAQSLVAQIAHDLHVPVALAGSVSTITQIGYGTSMCLLMPLGDLVDNRRLALAASLIQCLALLGILFSTNATGFFIAAFLLGIGAVSSQIVLTLSTHLTPPEQRGRVIGSVMGGLVTGIMLSRPLASLLCAHFGWRAIFALSAAVMAATLTVLSRVLPSYRPVSTLGWGAAVASTIGLVPRVRPLRERMFYQGGLFCIFNMFWTGAPLLLQGRFGVSQSGIALFALAGAGGAMAAPLAGRIADRGWIVPTTGIALLLVFLMTLLSGWSGVAGHLLTLTAAAIALDAAVQVNQIMGQRTIFGLDPTIRARLGAAYMTFLFLCGATGSVLGSWTYVHGGWAATMGTDTAIAAVLLLGFVRNVRRDRRATAEGLSPRPAPPR